MTFKKLSDDEPITITFFVDGKDMTPYVSEVNFTTQELGEAVEWAIISPEKSSVVSVSAVINPSVVVLTDDDYCEMYDDLRDQFPDLAKALQTPLVPEEVFVDIPEIRTNYLDMPEEIHGFGYDPNLPEEWQVCRHASTYRWKHNGTGEIKQNDVYLNVADYIFHLNDVHGMPREEIADRLDKLHDAGIIDLTITSKDPDRA